MSNVQKIFMEWAERTYPDYVGKFSRVEIESAVFNTGFCETCSYEYAGIRVNLYDKNRWVKSFEEEYDLASLLNEMLGDDST